MHLLKQLSLLVERDWSSRTEHEPCKHLYLVYISCHREALLSFRFRMTYGEALTKKLIEFLLQNTLDTLHPTKAVWIKARFSDCRTLSPKDHDHLKFQKKMKERPKKEGPNYFKHMINFLTLIRQFLKNSPSYQLLSTLSCGNLPF